MEKLTITRLLEVIVSAIAGVPFATAALSENGKIVTVNLTNNIEPEFSVDLNYALYEGKKHGVVWSRELMQLTPGLGNAPESLGLFPADTEGLTDTDAGYDQLKRNTMFIRRTIAAAIKSEGYWIIEHSRKFTMLSYTTPAPAPVVVAPAATEVASAPAPVNTAAVEPAAAPTTVAPDDAVSNGEILARAAKSLQDAVLHLAALSARL